MNGKNLIKLAEERERIREKIKNDYKVGVKVKYTYKGGYTWQRNLYGHVGVVTQVRKLSNNNIAVYVEFKKYVEPIKKDISKVVHFVNQDIVDSLEVVEGGAE